MPGLSAELYRLGLCHMIQKLQAFMSVANLGKQTLHNLDGHVKKYIIKFQRGRK